MTTTQLDLFGEVLAAEQQRRRDALVCLRDAMPDALQIVVELRNWRRTDTRNPHHSGEWAYCVSDAGIRFEHVDDWGVGAYNRGETWGWSRTPAHLLTWGELADLIGSDPRHAEITAWVESLPEPRWRQLYRPHELWSDPDGWHVGYLCRDHLDTHWPGRRHAWQLVLDLLTDTITTLGDQ